MQRKQRDEEGSIHRILLFMIRPFFSNMVALIEIRFNIGFALITLALMIIASVTIALMIPL